ncbi:YgaP family membrane protein [Denitratisoma oestradiolicum]|uniref:Inner membrane protein YgaP-like transmembrane domain-containing protein n=1 Tax=Denitratisoma oestradiolicum TaxID=311182 RepID=A0A6S6XYS7_9PROT|nr:DUF2892 domain-containing protein [Denitratisoma oestradiolicum]TWO79581.1 hypothetical protein CBW56_14300 [Denitratisoma oestradiolicum]CAB1368022.1 conserved protein of unknown function [Denitratisoma oestradiolicum]
MNTERLIRIFAGAFILISLTLAHLYGQADLSKLSWLWFTVFVGANLFQSGFTCFCPLEMILLKLGVPRGSSGQCK